MDFSYKELLAQQKALEAQIVSARQAELADVLSQVASLVDEYRLTEADVFGGRKAQASVAGKTAGVGPKFRDPVTGATWSGRGKAPRWIAHQDRSQFLI